MVIEAVDDVSDTFVCGVKDDFELGSFDREADTQIEGCFAAPSFQNKTFSYVYDLTAYDIRIIHNPERAKIQAGNFASNMAFIIVSKDVVPQEVMRHLEKLAQASHGQDVYGYLDNGGVTCMGLECRSDFDAFAATAPEISRSSPVFLGPPVQTPFDLAADQQIRALFASNDFSNRVFTYTYDGQSYQIRIVHNPEKRTLVADNHFSTFDWDFGIIPEKFLPNELANHLIDLAKTRWDSQAKMFVCKELATYCEGTTISSIVAYAMVRPARVFTNGAFDPEADEQIRQIFKSTEFINKPFSYNYNGFNYAIRVIHNPNHEIVKIGKIYYSMEWNDRYGIMSLQNLPWDLTKHLYKLIENLTWWSYLFDFTLSCTSQIGQQGYWYITDTYYAAFMGAAPQKS
jgi:hypothetical protein